MTVVTCGVGDQKRDILVEQEAEGVWDTGVEEIRKWVRSRGEILNANFLSMIYFSVCYNTYSLTV